MCNHGCQNRGPGADTDWRVGQRGQVVPETQGQGRRPGVLRRVARDDRVGACRAVCDNELDWRAAWVALSITMLCIGVIPAALFVRRQPEDMGLVIEGADEQSRVDTEKTRSVTNSQTPLGEVVRTPAFWIILVSLFLGSVAVRAPGFTWSPISPSRGCPHWRQCRR